MKKYLLLLLPLLGMYSCDEKKEPLKDFKWLEGSWTMDQDSVMFVETWMAPQGNLMKGSGTMLIGKDTLFSESVSIEERKEGIYYTAVVSENDGPVEFKLRGFSGDTAIFENLQHDFPQRIIYLRQGERFYAAAEGMTDGLLQREEFFFKRSR
jgi:hypothetical protein